MMFVRIIINLMVLFMLLGCGFMFDEDKESSDDAKVSNEIKNFAIGMSKGSSVDSVLKKSMHFSEKSEYVSKMTLSQKKSVESCMGGGSVSFDINERSNGDVLLLNIIANGCIDEGMKISYFAFVKVEKKDENLFKTAILLKEDATFEELETTEIQTFFSGSTMLIDEISLNEVIITENLKVSSSLVEGYESVNLIFYQQNHENSESSYELSGQYIYNGVIYSVDESYDGSKTPMTFIYENDKEFLASGRTKYYNEKREHITIEVVEKNMIKISVDTNNDGEDDAMETIFI